MMLNRMLLANVLSNIKTPIMLMQFIIFMYVNTFRAIQHIAKGGQVCNEHCIKTCFI